MIIVMDVAMYIDSREDPLLKWAQLAGGGFDKTPRATYIIPSSSIPSCHHGHLGVTKKPSAW